MESNCIREGLKKAMEFSALGNKFIQDNKPWELLKGDAAVQARGADVL